MYVDSDSSNEDIKFKFSPKTYTINKSQSLKLKTNSIKNESAMKKPPNNSLLSKVLPKQKCSSLAKVNNFSPSIEKAEESSESALNNRIDSLYEEWDKNFLGNSYSGPQSSLTGATVTSKNMCLNQYARTRKNLEKIVSNEPTIHPNTEVVSNDKTSSPAVTTSSLKALQSPPSKVISNSMMDIIKKWTVDPKLNVQNDQSLIKSDRKNSSDKIAMPNIKAPSKRKRSSPEIRKNCQIDVHDSPPTKKVKQSRTSKPKNLVDISNPAKICPNSNNLSSVKHGSRSTKIIKSEVPDSPPRIRRSRNTKMKDFIKTLSVKESKSLSPKKKQPQTTRNNMSSKSTKNNSRPKSTKTKKPKSTEKNASKSTEKYTVKSAEKNTPKSTEKNTAKSPKGNICIYSAKRQLSNSFEMKSPVVVLENINKELGELNSNRIFTSNKSPKKESEGMPKENHFGVSAEKKSILNPKENSFENDLNFCDDEQDPSLNTNITQGQSSLIPYKNSIRKNGQDFSSKYSSAKIQKTSINASNLQIQAAPINYENSNNNLSTVQTNAIGNNYSNPSSLMLQPLSNASNLLVPLNNNLSVNHLCQNPSSLMLQPLPNASNSLLPVNNTLSVNDFRHLVAQNVPTFFALQSANFVVMRCDNPLDEFVNIAKKSFRGLELVDTFDNSGQRITTHQTSEVCVRDHSVGFTNDVNLCYSSSLHIMNDKVKVMTVEQCKKEIKDDFTSSRLRVKQYYGDQDIQRFYRNFFTPYNSENLCTHTEFNLNSDFENTPIYLVVKKYMEFHLAELLKLYYRNSFSSYEDIIGNSKFTFVEKSLLSDVVPKHENINLKVLASSLTFLALQILFNEFKRREFERGEV